MQKEKLIEILANISSVWTIKKSLYGNYVWIHIVQLATLLRLLGLDTNSK